MLSSEKLKQNALTSIRLGMEDFQRAVNPVKADGDPERALSAARNLFAGILLLFKYGLALRVKNPEDVDALLFNPPKQIVPHPDGAGGVSWRPVGRFAKQTIDVAGIKLRFEAFGISVDWDAMQQLQDERNNLEHLHPTKSVGAIAGFVADMFPIVQNFVVDELEEGPADFLGPSWKVMLEHRAFFDASLKQCVEAWCENPVPDGVKKYVDAVRCDECGSQLIVPREDEEDKYGCVACGEVGSLIPQIADQFEREEGGFDPRDGEDPPLADCPSCDKPLFVLSEGACRWCAHEMEHQECEICSEALTLDDQHNEGLCSYCEYKMGKDD